MGPNATSNAELTPRPNDDPNGTAFQAIGGSPRPDDVGCWLVLVPLRVPHAIIVVQLRHAKRLAQLPVNGDLPQS